MICKLTNNKLYIEVDTLGAGLVSLRDVMGCEYLWQGDPKFWKGQAPLLFPIVGALREGRAMIEGKEYSMPRHGVARISEFKKVDSGADSITFRLKANDETKKMYPFDFTLDVEYSLRENSLIQRFTVTNNGEDPMPFCLGCHPGFNIPLEEGETIEDYVIKFACKESCDSPLLDEKTGIVLTQERQSVLNNSDTLGLCHEMFYKDALVLESLKSRKASMYSKNSMRGVEVTFDGFDYFGIWQAKDAPFVCLEPWTGTATLDSEGDDFAAKRGMKTLASGESCELIMKIEIM